MRAASRSVLVTLLAGSVILCGLLAWIGFSGSAVRFAFERAVLATDGRLAATGIEGSLARGLHIARLGWHDDALGVDIADAELRLDWQRIFDGRMAIGLLRARSIDVDLPAPAQAGTQAPAMPGSIGLPLAVLIGAVELDHLRLRPAAGETLEFTGLRARAAHLPGEYRIEALAVQTPWGDLAADTVRFGTEVPHRVDADVRLLAQPAQLGLAALRADAPAIALAATAAGDLERLHVQARARGGAAQLSARASLAPLTGTLHDGALLEFSGLDPAVWVAAAPRAQLGGSLRLAEAAPFRAEIELENSTPGRWPQGALPVTSVRASLAEEAGRLRLAPLDIRLAGNGRVSGELAVDPQRQESIAGLELPALDARLALSAIDAAQWLDGLRAGLVDGELKLAARSASLELRERARGEGEALLTGREPLAVELRAALDAELVRLEQMVARHGEAAVDAHGTVRLEPLTIDLAGRARGVDPAAWIDTDNAELARLLAGRIDAEWHARGRPGAGELAVGLDLGTSRLAGAALAGRAEARLDAHMRPAQLNADLALGSNRVHAQGALARPDDKLRWSLELAQPALFDSRLSGRVSGQGEVGLDGTRPWGGGELAVDGMDFEGLASLREARLQLAWPRRAQDAFAARVKLAGLVVDTATVEHLGLEVDGQLEAHHFSLDMQAAGERLTLDGDGAWVPEPQRWDATLGAGRLAGSETVLLEAGARLSASATGASLRDWRLVPPDRSGATARIDTLVFESTAPGHLASSGSLVGLPLARVLVWLDRVRGRPPVSGEIDAALSGLRVDGNWQLDGGITPQTLVGRMQIALREESTDAASSLGIDPRSGARVQVDNGRLDGRVDLGLPSLVFLRRYLGEDWSVDGRLRIAATVAGTVDAPRVDGTVRGADLAVEQRSQGWRLDQGELRARFDDQSVAIDRLRLAGGEGEILLSGQATLLPDSQRDPGTPGQAPGVPLRGAFDLEARQFLAPLEPGQRLVVSGHTRLTSDGRKLEITGRMQADEGLIELSSMGPPSLPDDIQIAGSQEGDGQADADDSSPDPGIGAQVMADVEVDLGRKIQIVGGGLDTHLEGLVRLRGSLPAAPRIEGTVRVRDGIFEAYGQRLDITAGSIRFNGPFDNPALDVTAMRPHLPVEVGVRITGTALSPRIALFSNPEIPDTEKLSWLVLGVPLADASSGAQSLALQQAAASLFSSEDGARGASLNQRLGVDMLGFGYAGGTRQNEVIGERLGGTGLPGSGDGEDSQALREVVTVGKRLASGIYVSYEQGLQGAWNLLRIQYDITRRLSLRLQTGSESAVDLLLQTWFD